MNEAIDELTAKYSQFSGINVYLSPLPLIDLTVGTTSQALYQYSLTSIDRKTLYSYSTLLTNRMRLDPSFSQVSSDLLNQQPQWNFQILRDKASNYNVTAQAIEDYLGWAYSDNKISLINGEINQYDVIVETLPRFYKDPSVLSKLYIRSSTNDLVPLSEIVQPTQTIGPLTVNHIERPAHRRHLLQSRIRCPSRHCAPRDPKTDPRRFPASDPRPDHRHRRHLCRVVQKPQLPHDPRLSSPSTSSSASSMRVSSIRSP